MSTIHLLRTAYNRRMRGRGHAVFHPRLEVLEDRRLLAACTVTNTNDDLNAGSLRYCLTTPTDPDPITISATGTIQLTSALPVIDWNVTIDGPGTASLTVQGEDDTDPYRIFEISSGTVTIQDLTISGGFAGEGGGIKNEGNLTLSNVVIDGNVAAQVDGEREIYGGGIWSSGSLTITDGTVIQNNKVMGSEDCSAVFSEGGGDSITVCPDIFGGGGMYLAPESETQIDGDSIIDGNIVCDDGDPCQGSISLSGNDSTTFYGGGIFNDNGILTITESTISDNEVHAIDPGEARAFRAHGGGLQSGCPVDDCVVIVSSTFSGNLVSLTGTADDPELVVETSGHGAAISMAGDAVLQEEEDPLPAAHPVTILNSTIANNVLESSVEGECPTSPAPFTGLCRVGGGAIWYKGIHMDIRWTSIVGNQATSTIGNATAAGILASDVPYSVLVLQGTLFVDNVIDSSAESNLVLSSGWDITSQGRNLFDDDPNEGEIMTDQVNTEVCFLPLGPQGGPTDTLELAKCGSTAIPALNLGGDPAFDFDQRGSGFDRIVGSHADVGAFECQSGECEDSRGGGGISLPNDAFGSNSSDVMNESGLLFDQDRGGSIPAEEPGAQVKSAVDLGGSTIVRVRPSDMDAYKFWAESLFALEADVGLLSAVRL